MTSDGTDFLSTIFKWKLAIDPIQHQLDSYMLNIFMEIDGRKNVQTISKILNRHPDIIHSVIRKLVSCGLIEQVQQTKPIFGPEFLTALIQEFSKAVGPIAEVIIDDKFAEMGINKNAIGLNQGGELVEFLSRQIPREDKKILFQKVMLEKIKKLK